MATTVMSAATSPFLEPFPIWREGALVESADYFSNISSKMSALHMMATSPKPGFFSSMPRISMPDKLSNQLRLWNYQYEVTFGLYVMAPEEKIILNTIVVCLLALIGFALYEGLYLFVVKAVCRFIYYMTGSTTAGSLCGAR